MAVLVNEFSARRVGRRDDGDGLRAIHRQCPQIAADGARCLAARRPCGAGQRLVSDLGRQRVADLDIVGVGRAVVDHIQGVGQGVARGDGVGRPRLDNGHVGRGSDRRADGVIVVARDLVGRGPARPSPVLVTVPVVEASTVTLIVTVASAPAGSVPRAQLTFPLASVQGLPWEGEAST